MSTVQFHNSPSGIKIAFRHLNPVGRTSTIVFLPGYMSDMDGGKATAVRDFCEGAGFGCLLLDYSGCGQSDGEFAAGSLSLWREEVLSLIAARGIDNIILAGSSMGGWLMLLIALELGNQLKAMVGIAAAPDFSDWGFTEAQKSVLRGGETIFEDNPYGPEPTPTHAKFWHDAETHRLLGSDINIDCPVRLLHGQRDAGVPWETSMELAKRLRSDDIQLTLVKDGDHRLSRDSDINLLINQVASLLD
ncbi:alpha/beta hydrolase [Pontixanthobacter gangjinensis]|uniref:Palmitoyl-protein thioesterase ABHD10, mitochondrial n=1 Tax=Pontixanthobacter gangjinensis TaxID=1028742 RepID=A0A6I4SM54_9SPHN|nr:alpha/beta hydrolase [Pontixanthobacter gangjinensis]MXO55842.1 alpha/beta fold hydrolase [Pontixanthobacter gangjinensis]